MFFRHRKWPGNSLISSQIQCCYGDRLLFPCGRYRQGKPAADFLNLSLHVGLGTFRPVKEEEITDHEMHSEYCMVPGETARIINETRKNGGRVICVGTTSCRTVESFAAEDGTMEESAGWTNIFIYPGYRFKVLDGLITNFHLPESTLIMLVSALAGKEHIMAAYEEAVKDKYRFFSFGDAMFITEDVE